MQTSKFRLIDSALPKSWDPPEPLTDKNAKLIDEHVPTSLVARIAGIVPYLSRAVSEVGIPFERKRNLGAIPPVARTPRNGRTLPPFLPTFLQDTDNHEENRPVADDQIKRRGMGTCSVCNAMGSMLGNSIIGELRLVPKTALPQQIKVTSCH